MFYLGLNSFAHLFMTLASGVGAVYFLISILKKRETSKDYLFLFLGLFGYSLSWFLCHAFIHSYTAIIFIFFKNPSALFTLYFLVKLSFYVGEDDFPITKKYVLLISKILGISIGGINLASYFYREIHFDRNLGFFAPSTQSDSWIVILGVFLFTLYSAVQVMIMVAVMIAKLKKKSLKQRSSVLGFLSVIFAIFFIVIASLLSDLGFLYRGIYLFVQVNSFNYIIVYFILIGLGRGQFTSGVGFKIMLFNLTVISMLMSLLVSFLVGHFKRENDSLLEKESYLIRNQITNGNEIIDTMKASIVIHVNEKKYLLNKSNMDDYPISDSRIPDFDTLRVEYFRDKIASNLFYTQDILANNQHFLVAYPYADIRRPMHEFVLSLLMVTMLGLGFVFLAYPLLHRKNLVDPLSQLTDAFEKVKKGDLDIYLNPHFNDEIGEITQSFNQMILVIKVYQETLELRIQERTIELENKLIELRNTQKQLIHSERMSTLGRISSNVAHEINNPLASIYASAKILEREFQKDNVFSRLMAKLPKNKEPNSPILKPTLSTKEKLDKKKNMETVLLNKGFEDPGKVADLFINQGVYEIPPHLLEDINLQSDKGIVLSDLEIYTHQMHIHQILSAVERASKISFALKHYSRTSSRKNKEPISLQEELESVLLIYNTLLGSDIKVEKYFDEVPKIMGYPEQLIQVWSNLIFNSIQAMPKQKGTIIIRLKKNLNVAIVEVEDDGIGIPEKHLEEVFDPFFTTKEVGVGIGLGLTIAKEVITAHNGTIEVESQKGSTLFRIMLPI